jgi:hypothetical protein
MNIPVRSRCHRILRHAKNYHCLLPDKDYFEPEYAKKQYPIHLDADELIIGIYENIPGDDLASQDIVPEDIRDNIVITDQALHLCSQTNSEKIYFKDIVALDGPENKINDLTIHLTLKSKKIVNIPILYMGEARNGCYSKDAFLFWSFLIQVVIDQSKLAYQEDSIVLKKVNEKHVNTDF